MCSFSTEWSEVAIGKNHDFSRLHEEEVEEEEEQEMKKGGGSHKRHSITRVDLRIAFFLVCFTFDPFTREKNL